MKVLIYTAIRINAKKSLGVVNKVKSQAKALHTGTNKTFYGVFNANRYQIIDSENACVVANIDAANRVTGRINQAKYTYDWCMENQIDLVYIRLSYFDRLTYRFAKKLHRHGVKVVLEIPTYPFAEEKSFFVKKALQDKKLIDYVCKKALIAQENNHLKKSKRVLDLIVTYNPTGDLFGVKTLCIDNGVDAGSIPLKKQPDNGKKIIFIIVASLSRWHGADRVIEGLNRCREYKGFIPNFWIVGEGVESDNLKALVKEYGLDEYVTFWGAKTGDELKSIIDGADIGIASLGMHRLGLDVASTLKVKEYCAYGLPFIYAYTEKAIDGNCEFALRCVSDDTPIDMERAIEFALCVKSRSDIPLKMRSLAEEQYDWSKIMQGVVDSLW